MDVTTLKKACGVGLLAAAAFNNPAAYAAQGNIVVDVNLPTVLVMYYWSNIDLNLDQAALGGYLVGGTASACGTDFCDEQTTAQTVSVTTIGANTPVTVSALNDPGLAASTVTFDLQDVVGVRALGCPTGNYQATYDVSGDPGIVAATGQAVTNIDGAACSLAMTTGNVAFDVDFTALTAGATTATATLDVTIVGI